MASHFKQRKILWPKNFKALEEKHRKCLKSLYVIFQVGCFVENSDGKVALFDYPSTEKHGIRKITGGKRLLMSWSPQQLSPDHLLKGLLEKTGIPRNQIAELVPYGVGSNYMPENPAEYLAEKNPKPGYLFLLFRARLKASATLALQTPAHPDKRKGRFIGWREANRLRIKMEGALDRLLVAALRSGARGTIKDETALLIPEAFPCWPPCAEYSFKDETSSLSKELMFLLVSFYLIFAEIASKHPIQS